MRAQGAHALPPQHTAQPAASRKRPHAHSQPRQPRQPDSQDSQDSQPDKGCGWNELP